MNDELTAREQFENPWYEWLLTPKDSPQAHEAEEELFHLAHSRGGKRHAPVG